MTRRRLLEGFGGSIAVTALAGCAQAPVTGRQQLIIVSDEQMAQAGAQAFQQLVKQEGVASNPGLQQRVTTVGQRIARVSGLGDATWQFVLIDDPTPNAFALPGGKVGVHTGLFKVAENDNQLAAVLGHEVAHVTARHAAERVSQQMLQQGGLQVLGIATQNPLLVQAAAAAATVAVSLPYSRTQESEADEIGIAYMARAGYDPRASIDLWQNMERASGAGGAEFLSTHPAPGSRIERLQQLMPKAMEEYRKAGGRA